MKQIAKKKIEKKAETNISESVLHPKSFTIKHWSDRSDLHRNNIIQGFGRFAKGILQQSFNKRSLPFIELKPPHQLIQGSKEGTPAWTWQAASRRFIRWADGR